MSTKDEPVAPPADAPLTGAANVTCAVLADITSSPELPIFKPPPASPEIVAIPCSVAVRK